MEQIIYSDNSGNTFTSDKLLSCPFCGHNPEILFIGNNYTSKGRKVTIKCKNCGVERTCATKRHDHEWIAKISIGAWNTRV